MPLRPPGNAPGPRRLYFYVRATGLRSSDWWLCRRGEAVKDRDLVLPVVVALVVTVVVLSFGEPIYKGLAGGMNAVAETVSHAGEDRAGRVR